MRIYLAFACLCLLITGLGNRENKLVEYTIGEDDRVTLNEVGWSEGIVEYKFLSIIHSFPFAVTARDNKDCGGTTIEEVALDDVAYQQMEGYFLVTLVRNQDSK